MLGFMGCELQQVFTKGDFEDADIVHSNVPGRTIILQQNKWNMVVEYSNIRVNHCIYTTRLLMESPLSIAVHRFTWVENNLVITGERLL